MGDALMLSTGAMSRIKFELYFVVSVAFESRCELAKECLYPSAGARRYPFGAILPPAPGRVHDEVADGESAPTSPVLSTFVIRTRRQVGSHE